MEKIAPTSALKWGGFENIDPMEQVKTIASLIGKEKEATSFIEDYQKKAEIAKYIPNDESVGNYSIWAKNFWVWPELCDASYNLFTTFGYKAPAKI